VGKAEQSGQALDNCDKPYWKTVGGSRATNSQCLYGCADVLRKADTAVAFASSSSAVMTDEGTLPARLKRLLKKALTFVAASRRGHFSRVARPFGFAFLPLQELLDVLQTHYSLCLLRQN
jgi:hypothetical protein